MFLKSLIVVLSIWQVLANNDTVLPPYGPTGLPPNVTTTPTPSTTTNNTTTTTTTTTAKTTTTATPAPKTTTTTAAPTPKPDNKLAINDYFGNYSDSKSICFMAKMALQIQLPNKDKNNSTLINVPKAANGTGDCLKNNNSDSETLLITWGRNSVYFEFYKNESQYEIQFLSTSLLLPGSNTTTTYCHNKTEFAVPEKLSYYCVKDQILNLTDCSNNVTVAELHLSHLHYQAFMNSTKAEYASVWNCDGANTSDVVPVVVGCVLAILVVLVLVAYLVGRRRCQARGYLSM